jgi:hypothetical protein
MEAFVTRRFPLSQHCSKIEGNSKHAPIPTYFSFINDCRLIILIICCSIVADSEFFSNTENLILEVQSPLGQGNNILSSKQPDLMIVGVIRFEITVAFLPFSLPDVCQS